MIDLVIRNGTVVDGTGAPRRAANIGIHDGRVELIGGREPPAAEIIDAGGLVVAPGFVDVHTHYDARHCGIRPSCRRRCTA